MADRGRVVGGRAGRRSTRRSPRCSSQHVWAAPPDRRARAWSLATPTQAPSGLPVDGLPTPLRSPSPGWPTPWRASRAIPICARPASRVADGLADARFAAAPWQTLASPPTAVRLPSRPDRPGRIVVASAAPASDLATPVLLRSIANAIADVPDLQRAEVVPIADAVLQRWSRPPAPVTAAAHRRRSIRTTGAGSGSRCCVCSRSKAGSGAARSARGRRAERRDGAGPCRLISCRRMPPSAWSPPRCRDRDPARALAGGRRGVARAVSRPARSRSRPARCVAVAVASWRWRSTSRASIVRALERAHPDARNLFVTADELARDALDGEAGGPCAGVRRRRRQRTAAGPARSRFRSRGSRASALLRRDRLGSRRDHASMARRRRPPAGTGVLRERRRRRRAAAQSAAAA